MSGAAPPAAEPHRPTRAQRAAARAEMKLQRLIHWGTLGLFFLLLLLGGGGAPNPIIQALLEALALAWLLALIWLHLFARPLPREALWPCVFLAFVLLLPAIQLIPLPYALWSALPGREQAVEAVRLAGLGEPWLPLSLAPERTVTSALPLLGAAAVLAGTYMIEPERRLSLLRIALVVILISALIGSFQFTMPNTPALYLHKKTYFDLPSGLFANRNFQSDLLLIGILLCALTLRISGFSEKLKRKRLRSLTVWETICLLGIPFLTLMALATLSRSGAVMLGPVLLAAFVIASTQPIKRTVAIGIAAVAAAALAFIAFAPGMRDTILSRFDAEASRLDALPDLALAADQYFPVGAGLGTFDPVFRGVESLTFVVPAYFNHAHNDYAELLIEAGLPGMVLLAIFLLAYAVRMVQLLIKSGGSTYLWMQRTAGLAIAILLVHSLADYPLRTMTMQALFAMLCALMFSAGPARVRAAAEGPRP